MPLPENPEDYRTENGGYTRAQLAAWGIAWPPPKGWKKGLPQLLSQPQPVFPVSASPSPDLAKWVLSRYAAAAVQPPLTDGQP